MGKNPMTTGPFGRGRRANPAAASALALVLALGGCSGAPEWAKPTSWYDNLFSEDPASAPVKSGGSAPAAEKVAPAPRAEVPPTTSAAASDGLAADRQNARYTETTLRSNPASAPPPPPAAPPPEPEVKVAEAPAAPPAPPPPSTETRTAAPVPPPPPPAVAEEREAESPPVEKSMAEKPVSESPAKDATMAVATADSGAQPAPPPPIISESPTSSPVPSIVQRPGDAGPAIFPRPERGKSVPPIVTSPPPPYPPIGSSDGAASEVALAGDAPREGGEAPPPLPPITSATAAPGSDAPPPAIPYGNLPPAGRVASAPNLPIGDDQSLLSQVYARNLAQQEAGNVTQTMTADGTMVISAAGAPPPSVFGASAGVSGGPALMVLFTHGGSGLGAKARGELGGLAEGLRNYQGYVRIVGHASHRTGNMSQARHVSANFNVSVDRANVVARELVRQGVAAERLIVEAVGDARPRYYENMPGGEAENRRVEIFLE